MVISIAEFAATETMKKEIRESFDVRNETLKRCYAMENYAGLLLAEKNRIYDGIRKQIESERRKIS